MSRTLLHTVPYASTYASTNNRQPSSPLLRFHDRSCSVPKGGQFCCTRYSSFGILEEADIYLEPISPLWDEGGKRVATFAAPRLIIIGFSPPFLRSADGAQLRRFAVLYLFASPDDEGDVDGFFPSEGDVGQCVYVVNRSVQISPLLCEFPSVAGCLCDLSLHVST